MYYVCRTGYNAHSIYRTPDDTREVFFLTDVNQREWACLEVADQKEGIAVVVEDLKELVAMKAGNSCTVVFKTADNREELLSYLNIHNPWRGDRVYLPPEKE